MTASPSHSPHVRLPNRAAPSARRAAALRWSVVALLLAVLAGCQGNQELPTTYGKRRGSDRGTSVNGTTVLARMFKQAGFKVSTWRRLSPKLQSADVIVWAPNRFEPPDNDARAFFDEWFWDGQQRTLVYIGRDYDAEITYWEQMVDKAPPEQSQEVRRRLAEARAQHQLHREEMPLDKAQRWFVMHGARPRQQVKKLSGPWSAGIDADKTEIIVQGRLDIPTEKEIEEADAAAAEEAKFDVSLEDDDFVVFNQQDAWQESPPSYKVLLDSDQGPLVYEVTDGNWGNGRVIVVQNGSFLLNLPLVNHEHRELASQLVAECGSSGKVVFVESGPGPVEVADSDSPQQPSGKEAFTTWPMNFVLLHAAVLGILFCMSRFPIFGPPRELQEANNSDFGRHISALGELFERAGAFTYVTRRLAHYQQTVRRESGASHASHSLNDPNAAPPIPPQQPPSTVVAPPIAGSPPPAD